MWSVFRTSHRRSSCSPSCTYVVHDVIRPSKGGQNHCMLLAYLRVCAEVCGGWLQSTICSDAEAPPSENLTRDADCPSGTCLGLPSSSTSWLGIRLSPSRRRLDMGLRPPLRGDMRVSSSCVIRPNQQMKCRRLILDMVSLRVDVPGYQVPCICFCKVRRMGFRPPLRRAIRLKCRNTLVARPACC